MLGPAHRERVAACCLLCGWRYGVTVCVRPICVESGVILRSGGRLLAWKSGVGGRDLEPRDGGGGGHAAASQGEG